MNKKAIDQAFGPHRRLAAYGFPPPSVRHAISRMDFRELYQFRKEELVFMLYLATADYQS